MENRFRMGVGAYDRVKSALGVTENIERFEYNGFGIELNRFLESDAVTDHGTKACAVVDAFKKMVGQDD